MLKRDSRFVLDNNLIIAAIKSGWTRSTDLLFTMMLSDATLLVDKELLFEYEKYGSSLFCVGKPGDEESIGRTTSMMCIPRGKIQRPVIAINHNLCTPLAG